jgi:hypothetical protein
MSYWQLFTASERSDGQLTGRYADSDRRFRLKCLVDRIIRAEGERAKAQRAFDAERIAAESQGQHALADESLKLLAERRAR